MLYTDRIDAGRRLARRLAQLRGENLVVLGLPRGGVPVAFEVAQALNAPLDVIVVRKLGVPFQPELGMGAIGEDGVRIINRGVMSAAEVTEEELAVVEMRERVELERRAERFRRGRPRVPLIGRTAVVVDDGIATGSTARAACRVARAHGAARVVLAVPVAPAGWTVSAGDDADELVCLETLEELIAISQSYEDFTQTTDNEVISCLERAASITVSPVAAAPRERSPADLPGRGEDVEIPVGGVRLAGHRTIPAGAAGLARDWLLDRLASDRHRPTDVGSDDPLWRDPFLEAAREEAEGIELYEDPFGDQAALVEQESAQGVEVFVNPDAVLPMAALVEGSPGHETFAGDRAGLGGDAESETREEAAGEDYEEWRLAQ